MLQKELISDGGAKMVYSTDNPEKVIIHYTDMVNAYHYIKKAMIRRKGLATCSISTMLYEYLAKNGIKTHFIEKLNDRDILCEKVSFVPMKVVVRNTAAGTMAERLGLTEGTRLTRPVFELNYRKGAFGDTLINDGHAVAMGLVTYDQMEEIHAMTSRINDLLISLFSRCNINLVDFKIEFAFDKDGNIVLADEISPDTCRLWDMETGERFDKDRYRRDLDKVAESYEEVLDRLSKIIA